MKQLSEFPFYALRIKLADRYMKYLNCRWWQFFKKARLWEEAQELEQAIKEKQEKEKSVESINHSIY